eukprot:scaffold26186_cov30-Tisochrysis_lutea.AAC.4
MRRASKSSTGSLPIRRYLVNGWVRPRAEGGSNPQPDPVSQDRRGGTQQHGHGQLITILLRRWHTGASQGA